MAQKCQGSEREERASAAGAWTQGRDWEEVLPGLTRPRKAESGVTRVAGPRSAGSARERHTAPKKGKGAGALKADVTKLRTHETLVEADQPRLPWLLKPNRLIIFACAPLTHRLLQKASPSPQQGRQLVPADGPGNMSGARGPDHEESGFPASGGDSRMGGWMAARLLRSHKAEKASPWPAAVTLGPGQDANARLSAFCLE